MRNKKLLKITSLLGAVSLLVLTLSGCAVKAEDSKDEQLSSDNVILTETGEVLEKEKSTPKTTQTPEPMNTPKQTAPPENLTPDMSLITEPAQEQVVTHEDPVEPQGNDLQLVFLGDSIFDTYRDGTGIPYRTAVQCEADVYNLAIGGTCAAVDADDPLGTEEWASRSLVGVVKAIAREIPTDIFVNDEVKKILDNPNVDFTNTDYFIVEYGTNDFFSSVPLDSEGEVFNLKTYAGALRYAAMTLKAVAPDATIILCSPAYARFFDGTWMIGDGNSVNNGQGTLFNYAGICQYVAKSQNALFFNAYEDLGIDGYTADEYLEDGVHLSDSGRQLYADALAKMILDYDKTKNN